MSKLDDALDKMPNRYATKQALKKLFLELTDKEYQEASSRRESEPVYIALIKIRRKVIEL